MSKSMQEWRAPEYTKPKKKPLGLSIVVFVCVAGLGYFLWSTLGVDASNLKV